MMSELCPLPCPRWTLGQHLLPLTPQSCRQGRHKFRDLGHNQSLICTTIYRTYCSLKWEELLVTAEVVLEMIQSIKAILFWRAYDVTCKFPRDSRHSHHLQAGRDARAGPGKGGKKSQGCLPAPLFRGGVSACSGKA